MKTDTSNGTKKSFDLFHLLTVGGASMASRYNEGKEFVKWLKQWRAKMGSHVSVAQTHSETRKDDEDEFGPDNGSMSKRKDIIPEPIVANKR